MLRFGARAGPYLTGSVRKPVDQLCLAVTTIALADLGPSMAQRSIACSTATDRRITIWHCMPPAASSGSGE